VTRLTPNLNVLPESQREVWRRLGATPGNFVSLQSLPTVTASQGIGDGIPRASP
jgi:hypothetical protein